jgi:hypothetical protein
VAESEEVRPGVVFDFDAAGRVLGIEMLDVSQRTDNTRELAHGTGWRVTNWEPADTGLPRLVASKCFRAKHGRRDDPGTVEVGAL